MLYMCHKHIKRKCYKKNSKFRKYCVNFYYIKSKIYFIKFLIFKSVFLEIIFKKPVIFKYLNKILNTHHECIVFNGDHNFLLS